MPIEVGFWNITDGNINKVDYSVIDSEEKLESIIEKDISILSDDLLLIGRQIQTEFGKLIDMLAIDIDGKVSIIELKKNKTPRDVVAQAIDYASWVQNLSYKDIIGIFEDKNDGESFEKIFNEKFEMQAPEKINEEHDIIIVCTELDSETERIINYLSDNYNVPINAVYFRYFEVDNKEFISRSWLIDPNEVIEKSSKTKSQSKGESWNGRDFVVNIDVDEEISTWEDSQKYNFISAGGGKWYYRSLKQLFPGARVFCMIPKKGFLGVGIVRDKVVPINDFMVKIDGKEKSILEVPLKAEWIKEDNNKPEYCEYLVRVEWINTVSEDKAYWEKGLRANQNSAFKLKSKFTLTKLIEFFNLEE